MMNAIPDHPLGFDNHFAVSCINGLERKIDILIEAEIAGENAPEEEEIIVVDDEDEKVSQAEFLSNLGLCTPKSKTGLLSKKPQRPQRACNVDPKHVRVISGESLRLFERQHRISKKKKNYPTPAPKVRVPRKTL